MQELGLEEKSIAVNAVNGDVVLKVCRCTMRYKRPRKQKLLMRRRIVDWRRDRTEKGGRS